MAKSSYQVELKKEFGELIDALRLTDLQKRFLRSRWLDQLVWTEGRAGQAQRRYYWLRIVAIVGGVILPALVSLDVGGSDSDFLRWTTFTLGVVVAAAVAVDGFFRFGERWRHYRRTAEMLKVEGWQFFELTGPYQERADHTAGFPMFADRVQALIQQDVDGFVSVIAVEKTGPAVAAPGRDGAGAPAVPAPEADRPPATPRLPAEAGPETVPARNRP